MPWLNPHLPSYIFPLTQIKRQIFFIIGNKEASLRGTPNYIYFRPKMLRPQITATKSPANDYKRFSANFSAYKKPVPFQLPKFLFSFFL